jgi:hypothetical protein
MEVVYMAQGNTSKEDMAIHHYSLESIIHLKFAANRHHGTGFGMEIMVLHNPRVR